MQKRRITMVALALTLAITMGFAHIHALNHSRRYTFL
jgi:hypothetical protein